MASLFALIGAAPFTASADPSTMENCGFGNTTDLQDALGRPVSRVMTFMAHLPDSRGGWANYDGSASWGARQYDPQTKLIVSVPIIPKVKKVTLKKAASGEYNDHYTAAAQHFVNAGHDDAYIRIGWEFQGDWYPWGYQASGQTVAKFCKNYRKAYRQVAKAFRKVSPNFKFEWTANLDDHYRMPDIEACYPGDDVVDFVGLDVYDNNYNHISDPKARFEHDVLKREFGLEWQADFAAAHDKPMTYSEWGAGGQGDNPYFIEAMIGWFQSHDVAYNSYWNSTSSYNGLLSKHPQERERYAALLGR